MVTQNNTLQAKDHWSSLKVEFGERVLAMTIDSEGNVYTGNNFNGVYKYDSETRKSGKNILGKYWVYALAATSDDKILAGTSSGLFYSTNAGEKWQNYKFELSRCRVLAIEIDINEVIYAAVENYTSGIDSAYIFKSEDNGVTWKKLFQKWGEISSLALSSQGYIVAGTKGLGVFISKDEGVTWKAINNGIDHINVYSVFFSKEDDLFIGAAETKSFCEVLKSKDMGVSWVVVDDNGTQYVHDFIQLDNGDIFYGSNKYGVTRSTNQGNTWSYERDSEIREGAQAFAKDHLGNYYYGGDDGWLLKSKDDCKLWELVGITGTNAFDIVVADNDNIWCGTDYSVLCDESKSSNIYFSQKLVSNIPYVVFEKDNNNFIYVSPSCCTSSSRYDNLTFKSEKMSLRANCFHLFLDNSMLAGTYNGVFRSTDHGENWIEISKSNSHVSSIYTLASTKQGAIIVGESNEIYITENIGTSWSKSESWPTTRRIKKIVVDNNDNIIVGTLTSGVFISKNTGTTWQDANSGLLNMNISELFVHPSGYVFAGTDGGGVFVSKDGCKTWEEMNSGLTNYHIASISLDNFEYILVGTLGSGIFKSNEIISSAESNDLSNSFFEYQNPFKLNNRITFFSKVPGQKKIILYNSLGNHVETLYSDYMNSGSIGLNINRQDLPSGMYYLRMESQQETLTKSLVIVK
jgi:photosystem II stability/assembly factor-like uncharacterized protein